MDLTANFSLEELVRSDTANIKKINNTPSDKIIVNLRKLANEVLQPIRSSWGKPIRVTSGYRCPKLNSAVKGSATSQHMSGEAADIKAVGASNKELFNHIKKMILDKKIKVGQLIWESGSKNEPNWIHVSLPGKKTNNILYIY